MVPKNWMELALKLAREGDKTAEFRRKMLDDQIRGCMDGMSKNTMDKIYEDRRRGILKRSEGTKRHKQP